MADLKTEDLLLGAVVIGIGYYFLKGNAKPKPVPVIPATNTGIVYTPAPYVAPVQQSTVNDVVVAVLPTVTNYLEDLFSKSDANYTDYINAKYQDLGIKVDEQGNYVQQYYS